MKSRVLAGLGRRRANRTAALPSASEGVVECGRPIRATRVACPALACVAALLLAPNALADAEPNNGIAEAEGPIAGAATYPGSVATENDADWYLLYASSQAQLDIALTNTTPDGCAAHLDLLDTDGGYIDGVVAYGNETDHVLFTAAPGTNRFYLEIDAGCSGTGYQVRVDPATGVTGGPGYRMPSPTAEPNESLSQAIGPLSGGLLYGGDLATENDVDWFFFHALASRGLDVAVTNSSPDEACGAQAELTDADGGYIDSTTVYPNERGHFRYTSPERTSRSYLALSAGCAGTSYQFEITPADAVTADPLDPASTPGCRAAVDRKAKFRHKVRRLKRQLAHASSHRIERRIKHKLRRAKRKLRRAKDQVRSACV